MIVHIHLEKEVDCFLLLMCGSVSLDALFKLIC